VQTGHIAVVTALIHAGSSIDIRNFDGFTPIALAILTKNTEMTKLILQAGANPNSTNSNHATCFIFPSIMGRLEIVESLLKAGADPNTSENLGVMGSVSPLHMAAEIGHIDVVEVLLAAGASIKCCHRNSDDADTSGSDEGDIRRRCGFCIRMAQK
jgi:ankyrin repeat protein